MSVFLVQRFEPLSESECLGGCCCDEEADLSAVIKAWYLLVEFSLSLVMRCVVSLSFQPSTSAARAAISDSFKSDTFSTASKRHGQVEELLLC